MDYDQEAPLCFEPLSMSREEIIGTDSDFDEPSICRSAKRRRIEHFAQHYLAGNPIYIFSSTLKGPFGTEWVNPWSRRFRRRVNDRTDESRVDNGSADGWQAAGLDVTVQRDVTLRHHEKDHPALKLDVKRTRKGDSIGHNIQVPSRNSERSFNSTASDLRGQGQGQSHRTKDEGSSHWGQRLPSGANTELSDGVTRSRGSESKTEGLTKKWLKADRGSTYSKDKCGHNQESALRALVEELSDHAHATHAPFDDIPDRSSNKLEPARSQSAGGTGADPSFHEPDLEAAPGFQIKRLDLADADAEIVYSLKRAKELSTFGASQASRPDTQPNSAIQSPGKPGLAPEKTSSDAVSALPSARGSTPSLPISESLRKLDRSSLAYLKTKEMELNRSGTPTENGTVPRVVSRTNDPYQFVSPSTDLPGFRYWHAKPGMREESPFETKVKKDSEFRKGTASKSVKSPTSHSRSTGSRTVGTALRHGSRETPHAEVKGTSAVPDEASWKLVQKYTNRLIPSGSQEIEGESGRQISKRLRDALRSEPTEGNGDLTTPSNSPVIEVASTTVKDDGRGSADPSSGTEGHAVISSDSPRKDDEPSMSTQTAVARIGRLFRDAIESPAPYDAINSSAKRASQDPNSELRQRQASPYSLFVDPARKPSGHSPRDAETNATPENKGFISTQMLLDAASPFTFSSAKKDSRRSGSWKRASFTPFNADDDGHGSSPRSGGPLIERNNSPVIKRKNAARAGKGSAKSKKSALKSVGAGTASTSSFAIAPSGHIQEVAGGEQDEVSDLEAAIDDMMGSILDHWDVEKALKGTAATPRARTAAGPAGHRLGILDSS